MGISLEDSSQQELVIWTQKDHFSFGDTVHVYGKFDFTDPILKNSNKFVDVSLNDRKVILDLPVHPNGWFAGYFTLSNPYLFYTGNNLLTVQYFHEPTQHRPDMLTHASYKFSTGNISTEPFFIENTSVSDDVISYKVLTNLEEPANLDLGIVRVEMPDGIVLSLPNISDVSNIEDYVEIPLESGTYDVSITKGDYSVTHMFEYLK